MAWRLARSLRVLRDQIDDLFPERSLVSDGTIGDEDHQATTSDHNPNSDGVVCAIDFTHDWVHGADMHQVSEWLRESKDRRLKYVIWNRRIFSSYTMGEYDAWEWRPYTGSNPHTKHMHVSVLPAKSLYDDSTLWKLGDEMTEDEMRRIVREEVAYVLGGGRITMPNVTGEPFKRYGNQGIVNSVWHATHNGSKIVELMDSAALGGDPAELAERIVDVLGRSLALEVVDEIKRWLTS